MRNKGSGDVAFIFFILGFTIMGAIWSIVSGCTLNKEEMVSKFGEPKFSAMDHVVIKGTKQHGVIKDIEIISESAEAGWTYRVFLYNDKGWQVTKTQKTVDNFIINEKSLEITDKVTLPFLKGE